MSSARLLGTFALGLTLALTIELVLLGCAPAVSQSLSPAASPPPTSTSSTTPTQAGKGGRPSGEVTVFAASSLTGAFGEIARDIERTNPGLRITPNFAGSPALRAQLSQGAHADLFAPADEATLDAARQDGSLVGPSWIFAENYLTIVVPAGNPAKIGAPSDLARPGLRLVLAQPDVPAGRYARQSLDLMSREPGFGTDFAARVLANVVSNESNVRQALAKVQLGEADASIVYQTDALAAGTSVGVVAIPATDNVTARYPIALVKDGPNPAGAAAFVAYLLSPAGQATLERQGFRGGSAPGQVPTPGTGVSGVGGVADPADNGQ